MKKQILLDNLEQLETKEYTKLTPILVPETFEELKELCKDNKKLGIGLEFIEFNEFSMVFKREGIICCSGDDEIVAVNRTPEQMWEIIRNLMEDK